MTTNSNSGDVLDHSLAAAGVNRINWAGREMPVLEQIRARFKKETPFKGLKIAACLHVTSETANLMIALRDGGAEIALCASNPLSTQDEVAAALVSEYGIKTFAIKGEDTETYYNHITTVLETKPHMTMDDGADLVAMLHGERNDLMENVIGGMEETTTGVIRLKSLAEEGKLKYPVIAVNDADTKHFFDNRYGTGQSTLDGITRATNILWAGKTVVIIGYGWCGRGVAMRARGMGANTVVCEVNHIRALEAAMDGHQVMKMEDAAKLGDIFITVTGGMKAVDSKHVEVMKDGAVLANSGHFNVEIDIEGIENLSDSRTEVRPYVDQYTMSDGRRINLLGEGRLINLAAAEGHPSAVMDMSFADQALSAEFMANEYQNLDNQVYVVPRDIDNEVGRLKLLSMGIEIDELSDEQEKYLNSWNTGT
ncbi:MAG: adenosylhomocysteinase [SAR202 cluster bacterium]|nr:adenosylhomocysteinase [SAR202 cluster bacterium]MQG75138.1 adenosylhomocysteinase [SAR202 cluster bacterium]